MTHTATTGQVQVPLRIDVPVQLVAPTRAAELLALPVQTIETVAELLQVSESAIQRLVADGQLGSRRIGRLVRIPTTEIARFINEAVS